MNPNEENRTTPPSLLPRSIALVRLELSGSKVASTAKEHVFFVCANATSVRSGKGSNFTSARVQIIKNDLQLRQEFEKRSEDNAAACSILHNNHHLWEHVGGPSVDTLFRPTLEDIEKAKQCCDAVQKMQQSEDRDGMSDS